MTVTEVTSKRRRTATTALAPMPDSRVPARPRMRMIPFLITLGTLALAAVLGSAAWGAYMGTPWTRDATVRAYVVAKAPEVAGRIVELHVADNEYVRKGDLLMVIDPTNYTIAVSQAEAAVRQARRASRTSTRKSLSSRRRSTPTRHSWTGRRRRSCSPSSRRRAIRPWQKMGMAAFRMRSNTPPNCISRRLRWRLQWKTSTWRSRKSRR
jgi:multidrug resistance efflux pump